MTTTIEIYKHSLLRPRKRWKRGTAAEVASRRECIFRIVEEMKPMTVRQVFYQATVRGIVEKSEVEYTKVQTDLTEMRKSGEMPYGWLVDNTRLELKPRTFNGPEEALVQTARLYRKALWTDIDAYVEIWIEKDALAGVVHPVTDLFDVSLMVARGYASLSFLHVAAEYINTRSVLVYIYHLGDHDPSGVNAAETIEASLREMAPDADITFERLAVTRKQIWQWHLPGRRTKTTDRRAKGFSSKSVDLDEIEPNQLRKIVRDAIERHLPVEQFNVLKDAEERERILIQQLVNNSVGTARFGFVDERREKKLARYSFR